MIAKELSLEISSDKLTNEITEKRTKDAAASLKRETLLCYFTCHQRKLILVVAGLQFPLTIMAGSWFKRGLLGKPHLEETAASLKHSLASALSSERVSQAAA